MNEKALIDWVEQFMERNRLFCEHGVVALSGGADSLLLSHVLEALKNKGQFKSLRHVHVDHQLRSNSSQQAAELREYCHLQGWDFQLHTLTGANVDRNVESWARKERYKILKQQLKELGRLYLGHHIDDSFEWFLRQLGSSSASGLTYGIPLVNGPIARPFHCLTKNQILYFCQELELPIQVDQSNEDIRFQRNMISNRVKTPFIECFPKGLAHYSSHANDWAQKNGLSRSLEGSRLTIKGKINQKVTSLIHLTSKPDVLRDWSLERFKIVEALIAHSSKGRGEIRQNLDKLINAAMANGVRGPMTFSGGAKVYLYPGSLLFTSGEEFDFKSVASDIPLRRLSMKKAAKMIEEGANLGFVLFNQAKLFGHRGMKSDPLLQDLIDQQAKRGVYLRPFSQLYQKAASLGQLEREFLGQLI